MVALLVVDDEQPLREIIADLLSDEGFEVRTACNGREALELHAVAPADLILSDVMMPQLDGVNLVRTLRERGDLTPMVLMSAAPRPVLPDGVGWVSKPFEIEEMIATITAFGRTG